MAAPALLLSAFLGFSLFPNVTLKPVDAAFKLESLNGKRLACADSSVTKNGWIAGDFGFSTLVGVYSSILPDLDGIYARSIFDSTYVPATVYTGPLSESLCDIVVKQHKAVKVGTRDSADYALTLRYIKLYQRVNMQTVISIESGAAGGTAAFIRIDAEDKFGFGGKGRFQKGFENLKTKTVRNMGDDYLKLLKDANKKENDFSRLRGED